MIRQMRKEDFRRVEEIWYQESIRKLNWMDDPQTFWGKRRESFKGTIGNVDTNFVYCEDGIVIGFVIMGNGGYIPEIFVDDDRRKDSDGKSKGIGRALIDKVKSTNSYLKADVHMLNYIAIKFYIKNNFVIKRVYAEPDTGFAKFRMEWKKEDKE